VDSNDSTTSKILTDNSVATQMFNEQTKDQSFPTSLLNDETIKDNSTADEKLNEIFVLTKKKLQPTLNALQDKKDEILSASKNIPNSFSGNDIPRKSILRSVQSKSVSNADVLLAAIKQQQQQTEDISNKTTESPEEAWIKNAVNYGIDSGIEIQPNEVSLDKTSDKSISTIRRSYASLPLSTPAVRDTSAYTSLK
jgi:hypothetical protein